MKIVIAPNAFKESLPAHEAARSLARGLRKSLRDAELVLVPVADGGDGTADALRRNAGGRLLHAEVTGPLGEPVRAARVRLSGRDPVTDVVELARTSGLALVPPAQRDPMKTTTRGFGEMIGLAMRGGARRIIVAIGGSATVDGGAGMAAALGFELLDSRGRPIPDGGRGLEKLESIRPPANFNPPEILVACDVSNPLLGPRGAAAVFGPQKGATPTMIPRLEKGLERLASRIERDLGARPRGGLAAMAGGGAAGGVGAGLVGFLGAKIESGAELVLRHAGFERALEGADFVITGEGRLDTQTLGGKAPAVVARMASARGIPVIGVAGSVDPELAASRAALRRGGWTACLSIVPGPMNLADAMADAPALLENAGVQIGALIGSRKQSRGRTRRD